MRVSILARLANEIGKWKYQVKMTDVLALAVGFSVRHNTDPPVGFDETDTLMTVTLVYEIK
jgi:putative salt-induced outer membrane protein